MSDFYFTVSAYCSNLERKIVLFGGGGFVEEQLENERAGLMRRVSSEGRLSKGLARKLSCATCLI